MKKLSLCIPTFNRSKFLAGLLENILEQITDDIRDDIEICISNNASTDDTEETVDGFIKSNKELDITYSRNETNNGWDNFITVVTLAKGEYCWIIGDDDLLAPGGLKKVLNELKRHADVGIAITSVDRYDSTMSRRTEVRKVCTQDKLFDLSKPKELYDYFSAEHINYSFRLFVFISNVIFKREYWQDENKLKKAKSLKMTIFPQTYIHLQTIADEPVKLLLVSDVCVFHRSDNMRNQHHYPVFQGVSYLLLRGLLEAADSTTLDADTKDLILKGFSYEYYCRMYRAWFAPCSREEINQTIDDYYSDFDKDTFPEVAKYIEELKSMSPKEYFEQKLGNYEHSAKDLFFTDYLKNKNTVIFGSGFYGELLCRHYLGHGIKLIALSDNNKEKHGTEIEGIPIIPPGDIPKNAAIVISFVKGYEEQERVLREAGYKDVVCLERNLKRNVSL